MRTETAFAPGKIILCGEHAVVHGYPGIAIPTPFGIEVLFTPDDSKDMVEIQWQGIVDDVIWRQYAKDIVDQCRKRKNSPGGTITIESHLPLGKGMGSSTALVIAIARALLGPEAKDDALSIEEEVNPGASGIDFAVIWNGKPVLFRKGEAPTFIDFLKDLLRGAILIDTGTPTETTKQLVAWMKSRLTHSMEEIQGAFKIIGSSSERILGGKEDLKTIIRDHHRAQVLLGVVPKEVQALIASIEAQGGAAKVIGAGGRDKTAGMVLTIGIGVDMIPKQYPVISL